MDNNLDKYFRDKLGEREFPFDETNWLAAEQLLAGNDRKRRRGLLFWWSGAAAALFTAFVVWFCFFEKTAAVAEQTTDIEQKKEKTAVSVEAPPAALNPANTGKVSNAVSDAGRTAIVSNDSGHKKGTTPPAKSQAATNPANAGRASNPAGVSHSPANVPAGTVQPEQASPSIQTPNSKTAEQAATRADAANLSNLTLREIYVEGLFPKKLKTTSHAERQSPLRFGVMAAQLFQTNARAGEETMIGFETGLTGRYRLNKGWFLSSGLIYQRRSGTFEASKIAESRRYRFGVELDTQLLRPSSLHYFSLPVMLGWQRRRHVLEGGLRLHYLVGVRGAKGIYERTTEPPIRKEFKAQQTGWLVEDGYKKINAAATVGYSYQVNRQLSFGVSANYTFGGILDKNYEPPVGGFLLKEADRFYLGLQAVYFVK